MISSVGFGICRRKRLTVVAALPQFPKIPSHRIATSRKLDKRRSVVANTIPLQKNSFATPQNSALRGWSLREYPG